MSKIKDLPLSQRPREKALLLGIESLSDIELLALLIGSGVNGHSALDIAYNIFNDAHSWYELCQFSYQKFNEYKGLKDISSLKIVASLEVAKRYAISKIKDSQIEVNSSSLIERYKMIFSNYEQEHLLLVLLNGRKKLIKEIELYKGTDQSIETSMHDIYKTLLLNNTKYYYVLHNHPGGDPTPSEKDILFTANVMVESKKINVKLLDHLIIGSDSYYSFDEGQIKPIINE